MSWVAVIDACLFFLDCYFLSLFDFSQLTPFEMESFASEH
mgnify:CR=1 FL=1